MTHESPTSGQSRPLALTRRRVLHAAALALPAATISGPSAASPPTREVLQALAPTGKLRVALYAGPTNVIRGAAPEEMRGVGFDLGRELAGRLGVPFEPVVYPNPAGVLAGLKKGEWDVAFPGVTPERQAVLSFTEPFLLIEHGYLVPAGSRISTIVEVDRAGIRIGTPGGGSVNATLASTIKHATVVPTESPQAGAEMLKAGQLDVFAANKANLFAMSDALPGSRVLNGRIGVDRVAIALPKGREAGLPYLQQFLDGAKSEGRIAAAVKRAGVRGTVDR